MAILVTGGAGFIGSHLVEGLLENNYSNIIVLDNLSTGKKSNLPDNKNINFVEGDVVDQELIKKLIKNYSFEFIFHLAAIASVQKSFTEPQYTHKVNFESTLNLLETVRSIDTLKRFVFASSAAVYGDKPQLPCAEEGIASPISPYGIDKYSSERYVLSYNKHFGIPATAFRFFNVYGPRQDPSSPYSGVISIFLDAFKKERPEINIFGNGKQTRDFIYVKDLVKIIINSIRVVKSSGECYNICSGIETSLNQLLDVMECISGKSANRAYLESRPGDIFRSVGDNTKLFSHGLNSNFTLLKQGLEELFHSQKILKDQLIKREQNESDYSKLSG